VTSNAWRSVDRSSDVIIGNRLSRAVQWRGRLALVTIGLLLPVLLLEAVLRVFGPVLPGEYQLGSWLVPDPRYGHFHARGVGVWLRTSEFVTYVRTNQSGLRGEEVPSTRAPGEGRILALGDSFVEARQVREPETATSLIERALNRGPQSSCRVLNGGVAGWGTGEEYVYLQQEGLALRPDLVIIFFYVGNDVANNLRRPSGQAPQHRGPPFRVDSQGRLQELPFEPPERPSAPLAVLRGYSRAFNLLESGVLSKLFDREDDERERPDAGKLDLFSVRETSERRQAWQVTEALLAAIRDQTRASGAELGLVAIPASYQVYSREWARIVPRARGADTWQPDVPNRRLAEVVAGLGIPYLDLLPAFRAASGLEAERLYFPINAHWTPSGNRLAADQVVQFLAAHPELLPAGCR